MRGEFMVFSPAKTGVGKEAGSNIFTIDVASGKQYRATLPVRVNDAIFTLLHPPGDDAAA